METNLLSALSDAMVRAVDCAAASTVHVDARKQFGASGIAVQPDLILTANHVVERNSDIRVSLPDGSQTGARVLGRDPETDLCLLQLERAAAFPAVAAEQEAQVGQIVMALGRPESGEGIQASLGVVGAVGGPLRTNRGGLLERFIRTDAIPYPGFSGGPLIDGEGHVLGINTSGFAPGASLAIPAAAAWRAAGSLQQYGRVRRAYLGIRSQEVELPPGASELLGREQRTGLLLVGVERGQPAERAGLIVGDILTGMDGQPITDHDSLLARLSGDAAEKTLLVEALRGGRLVTASVTPGERSAAEGRSG